MLLARKQNFRLAVKVKVKAKCTLVQALRLCTGRTSHRESRGIALLFLDHGSRRGEGSASRPGRSVPPGKKTRYPLYRRLSGPQDRSGQVREISPLTGIRSPDRPARSQSLYRLRYPAHRLTIAQRKHFSFLPLHSAQPSLQTANLNAVNRHSLKQLIII